MHALHGVAHFGVDRRLFVTHLEGTTCVWESEFQIPGQDDDIPQDRCDDVRQGAYEDRCFDWGVLVCFSQHAQSNLYSTTLYIVHFIAI